jgi:hypothetical protein
MIAPQNQGTNTGEGELPMNRLLWIVLMLSVAFVPCSYADSFQITQVTGTMAAQTAASADNLSFTFTGPGTTIHASGIMMCYPWCYNDQGFQPDTSYSIGDIFVTNIYGPVTIGGTTYNSYDFDPSSFFAGGGGLNPSVVLLVGGGTDQKQIELTLPQNGQWSFHFDYFPPTQDSSGGYLFSHGEFFASSPTPVPEPGTLGLMCTGLAGIIGLVSKAKL